MGGRQDRVLLSHDEATLTDIVIERIDSGKPVPGVVIVPMRLDVGRAIDDVLLLAGATTSDDWQNPIWHLPL